MDFFIKQVLKQDNGVILHSLNPLYKDIFYKNGDFLLVDETRGILFLFIKTCFS